MASLKTLWCKFEEVETIFCTEFAEFDAFATDATVVDEPLGCGVDGVTVVNVDEIVANEGVDGGGWAAPPLPIELDIVFSLGVDGK